VLLGVVGTGGERRRSSEFGGETLRMERRGRRGVAGYGEEVGGGGYGWVDRAEALVRR